MKFDRDFTMTIDGASSAAESSIDVFNPASGEPFAQAPDCSTIQLDTAVAAARAAFPGWRDTPAAERQALVRAAGTRIAAHRDELSQLLMLEHGKPQLEAKADVMSGAYWCKTFANMELPVRITEDSDLRRIEVHHTPIGVVAALAAWNYPVLLAMIKSAPGLVTGNTVVLKPSPYTPLTTLKIGELLRDLFPPGVFNVVSGGDELGPLLTEHAGIDKITFTGSTATGRKVLQSASSTVKRVTLELGGNDAAIILPDIDVEAVAEKVFAGAFANTGQMCVAVKRLYIHEDIFDLFAEQLVKLAKASNTADGSTASPVLRPVQNKQQFERINSLIDDSIINGHKLLCGGYKINAPGYFIPITIIDNPPEDSRIVTEEQFGPVLPLLKFRDDDDVIQRANDTSYGLGGQVWSGDLTKAFKIASRMETGSVFINENPTLYGHTPFGGHKASGLGVESSLDGLLAFTNLKIVAVGKTLVGAPTLVG